MNDENEMLKYQSLRIREREKLKEGILKEITHKESSNSFAIESCLDAEEEKSPKVVEYLKKDHKT